MCITGGHSKWDPILLVKIVKYLSVGFCVYRRSFLIWSSVVVLAAFDAVRLSVTTMKQSKFRSRNAM